MRPSHSKVWGGLALAVGGALAVKTAVYQYSVNHFLAQDAAHQAKARQYLKDRKEASNEYKLPPLTSEEKRMWAKLYGTGGRTGGSSSSASDGTIDEREY
jgi:hypothetical protein